MAGRTEEHLQAWLAEGRRQIGQIRIESRGTQFVLRHVDDAEDSSLRDFAHPDAALDIARYNEAGDYRPLKTAPDLRRGWRLRLETMEALVLALEYFYPAMLGSLRAAGQGRLTVTPLRQTLERQSGLYAVTRKATVEQAEAVIAIRCSDQGGCLKKILWPIEDERPRSLPPAKFRLGTRGPLDLPCAEGCNLLVAAIRKHLKNPA